MTTQEERQRLYKIFTEIKQIVAEGQSQAAEPYPNGFHGGISDEYEDERIKLVWEQKHHRAIGRWVTANELWSRICGIYPRWDIELAVQENEQRIGTIPYEG